MLRVSFAHVVVPQVAVAVALAPPALKREPELADTITGTRWEWPLHL